MITPFRRKVVVGVGPDGSLAAVDVAAAEAQRRELPLELLCAYPARERADGPHTTLAAILHRVCATWPELRVTARNLTGDPAEALIDASRGAALIVVGRDPHPHPDSVGAQVAAHAHCPTVIAPPELQATVDGKVMVGIAMSGDDDPAIGFAFEQAALRGVPLLAVHVWSGMPNAALAAVSPFAYDLKRAESAADRLLAEALAGWSEKYPDVTVERMPLYDASSAKTLLDASTEAGLVVVGARRHARRSSQLLGTVTRTLMRRAHCPVAVVRATGHDSGGTRWQVHTW
jgi:nucleotide-binding universal stress UspA family protein